jgi:hypothetical protein
MGTVTESIYSGKAVIVPLADVQHIETHNPLGLIVVTRHTRWDCERDVWANSIWINADEADAFKAAWCRYRSELEVDTLADLSLPSSQQIMAGFDRAIEAIKNA